MEPAFVNNYSPPAPAVHPPSDLSSTEPYDINFAFPLHPATLTSSRVRITPFVPRLHAQEFWNQAALHYDALFRYYPTAPRDLAEFLEWMEYFRSKEEWCTFAVLDRTGGEERFAGMLSLINTSGRNLWSEIGFVMILPSFQRTHVARTAIALMLRYLLQTPTSNPPGLGFRRVQWCAHPGNVPSIGLAKKMGFKEEGLLRWLWALPDIECMKNVGVEVKRRGEEKPEGWARHTAVLSLCWDDWEDGGMDRVKSIADL